MDAERHRTLARLGVEPGSGFLTWRLAVERQMRRVEEARDGQRPMLEGSGSFPDVLAAQHQFIYDAHFLLVAIRNVLRNAELLRKLTGDGRVDRALRQFDRRFPDARNLRDVLEHFDAYLLDEGRLQGDGKVGAGASLTLAWAGPHGLVLAYYDRFEVALQDAGTAAIDLAIACDEVRRERLDAGPR
jgi:hypothetical protein